MTRQIAFAIFLAATVTMLTAAMLTYWVARQTLLAELDQGLQARAVASLATGTGRPAPLPAGDRLVVENDPLQSLSRSTSAHGASEPVIIARRFTSSHGERLRTIVLDVPNGAATTRVVYSGSAASFHRLQNRLAAILTATVLLGGGLTFATAVLISRRVTRPLQHTASIIGTVDDTSLHRRIDPKDVPSELVPMVERLNQMLARLEDAFRRQSQFLADAAHELRTPVAALRASLEITLSRPRTAEQLTATMRRAVRETLQLGEIVETLLDCVRCGSASNVRLERCDLCLLVQECVDQVLPLVEGKRQTLVTDLPGPAIAHIEVRTLRTALRNLLSNATSYTPEGGRLGVSVSAEGGSEAVIRVWDAGPGIPLGQRDQVFEPFYRGDESHSPREHLGLGLYLVRRSVDRLGGRLELKSEVGAGCTFSIGIPTRVTSGDRPHAVPTAELSALGGAVGSVAH